MAIYMPPISRKKRVPGRYNPDTFRVISTEAEEHYFDTSPPCYQELKKNASGLQLPDIYNRNTQVFPKSVPDYRVNRPHPKSCGFLRHNVRLLNEPVCSVFTESTNAEQAQWWPSWVSNEPLPKPPHTLDTIYREDYHREKSADQHGSLRHTANPNTEPAHGIIPVNFLKPRDDSQQLIQENISYEHMYNCRSDKNYPIRSKRHGALVWKQMSPDMAQKFIEHNQRLSEAQQIQEIGVTSLPSMTPYKQVISAEEGVRRQEEAEKHENQEASKGLVTQAITSMLQESNPKPSEDEKSSGLVIEETKKTDTENLEVSVEQKSNATTVAHQNNKSPPSSKLGSPKASRSRRSSLAKSTPIVPSKEPLSSPKNTSIVPC
ncbi:hypothetical protein ACJMK2_037855 [Sinanodonta woodiana]|uniref:Uncharacterized protein n=1 Tax=Sinanodonta woodiana TaxID=1069815 RepID=A0ABD3WQ88_SINWO